MLIRLGQYIHTALEKYSYGPVRIFNKSATNWLFLYWPWYRFSVSSIVVYCKVESIEKSRVGYFAYSLDDVVASTCPVTVKQ